MNSSLHIVQSGDKDRPVLFLLHGFLGSTDDWTEIIKLLEDDFNIIAIDLPGHGHTDIDDKFFEFDNCAKAVNDTIEKLDLNNITMIGYSMGGRLALYLALKFGNRIKNLVLESTSPGLATEPEREKRKKLDSEQATELKTGSMVFFLDNWYRQPLFEKMQTDRERFENLMIRRLKNSGDQLARSLQGMGLGSQPSLWDNLSELAMPSHLIVGEKDSKFVKIAEQMKTEHPLFNIIKINDVGHNVHFEDHIRYAELIRTIANS